MTSRCLSDASQISKGTSHDYQQTVWVLRRWLVWQHAFRQHDPRGLVHLGQIVFQKVLPAALREATLASVGRVDQTGSCTCTTYKLSYWLSRLLIKSFGGHITGGK